MCLRVNKEKNKKKEGRKKKDEEREGIIRQK